MTTVTTTTTTTYSHSQLDSYKQCPLRYFYEYEVGLRKRGDESSDHHLRFGEAIHEGLRHLYLGDTLKAAQEAFLSTYPVQLDPTDLAKTRENGVVALASYARRWRDEDRKWKVVSCEKADAREDGYIVHLDLVMENLEQGGIYGFDHKTTGKYLNSDYWLQFNPNSQITQYVKFIKERYGECDGFYINALSFRFRQHAYKGEPAGFWNAFERQMFNRNEEQLTIEQRSESDWIADIERSREVGVWRINTNSCRFCSYRAICAAGWSYPQDQELIEVQYRQVCNRTTEELRRCVLDRDHDGKCSPVTLFDAPMEVVVEV
jgi:hypothetical protein